MPPARTRLRHLAGRLRRRAAALRRPSAGARDARLASPRGYIDAPGPGAEVPRAPLRVAGWCLFPGSSVARVDVRLEPGGAAEAARIAMEHPSLAATVGGADAAIAAFEHKLDITTLPDTVNAARVEAIARSMDGRELRIGPVEFAIAGRERVVDDGGRTAEELRRRSMSPVRAEGRSGGGLRVLGFTHMLTYGGGALYLAELLQRVTAEPGFEAELVSLADGPLRPELEDAGIRVHVTDGFPVTSVARYEGHLAELLAWAATRRFDAALVNTMGAFAGVDLAERLGIPAVWAVHESFTPPLYWFNAYPPGTLDPYVRGRGERALRDAAAVVFEAEATRRLFLGHAEPERLLTLPYGIELDAIDAARDTHDRAELRRELGIEQDARVVLCLGSIEPRKAQAMLAQAFAQVADRHPRARLVLVGATEDAYCAEYRRALREYVDRAGLADRVRIEPVTGDPLRWHAAADALVCASDVESLPRVIIEAMAFGTPVLSTRVFGVPELIEDGRTGYLCEMRDLDALAGGLDRILSASDAELAAIGRAASEHARVRHDPDAYARQIVALLRGFAADPQAVPADVLGRTAAVA